ncbi:gamma-mobile-trio integrase GmtZ [Acidithiobacillus ferridurans]|jgi:hypothetical protein|uniref:Integrase n=4 Tax=Acidithiobacillus ferridurans TaxID=1232575 RepID=A0A2Z6INV5_ACIFI|nr:VPA1269 family protein [Acidithiobacillus ferridurans]MBU2716413.1 integrase [Acidithiobacillus ferridurans]MBU2723947.1 integrase [Acidithiobacillus ferridurans]BBF66293.1 hypothetical protein AFERRID_25110 [Acidithiobacillus ferridurans]BBF66470.1 hypothetical protein AFERRID_26880 [Acidithiobacillus ferridurans]
MAKRINEELRQKAIKLVNSGYTKRGVAEKLGIGTTTVCRITKHIGKTTKYYPKSLTQDVLQKIKNGQTAASVSREMGIEKSLISAWQKKDIGHSRSYEKISEEIKEEIIGLIESGIKYTAVGRQLNLKPKTVWSVFKAAESAGKALKPSFPNKRVDFELTWVIREYQQFIRWQKLGVEWLKGEQRGIGLRMAALTVFFSNYLQKKGLPYEPEAILRHDSIVPEFFSTACPQSGGGVAYNNRIHDFIDWVLLQYYSYRDDNGKPIILPAFRNPVRRITTNGFPIHYETVNTPLPYGYIVDLKKLLAQGPSFKDWTWAQNALGAKRIGEPDKRMSNDWFSTTEDQIDKDDPDCVWRIRRSIDHNVKPILEMWSPVRWVALLIKLQLPPRTFQVRMLDSGEADTWRYVAGAWIENTTPLAMGTKRNPVRQGVLRRTEPIGQEELLTTLYINTNKTADILKSGVQKGYEFPWPTIGDLQDQPHYWLEKIRNWQEKYNPIIHPTSWRSLPQKCIGEPKSDMQLASYPDTYFIFRSAERKKYGEAHLPITDGIMRVAWAKLLQEMQNRLSRHGTTHPDGSPIVLVTKPGSSPLALFPLHSLRVSLITALAIDGSLPFHLLVKLVGHSRLIMTIYYTKPGFKYMQDALIDAVSRVDALKEESIVSFLANEKHEILTTRAIWNSTETLITLVPEHPANRNPAGWMLMHHGLCLVGGNTSEVDSSSNRGGFRVGGCYNGGIAFNPDADQRTHNPVPGGIRNCIRCRWFVTEPHYIPALAAHLGNICYQFDEVRNGAIKQDAILHDIKRKKADVENSGEVFTRTQELRTAERIWESTLQRFNSLAEDMAACWQIIQRCNALPVNNDNNKTSLIAAGSAMDVQIAFEEVDSELLQLSDVCQNVEIYPDLDPGKAVFRRSQLLDAALARDHLPPFFLQLNEADQLKAGNAFMRRLSAKTNTNPLLGMRKVCSLMDAGESLAQFIGIDIQHLLTDTLQSLPAPLQFGYENA